MMAERFHTHLDDLLPIMLKHLDKQWILLHASMSIKNNELLDVERKLRSEHGINVRILIDPSDNNKCIQLTNN